MAAFGILCNIAGLELGNLWAFSDFGNILIVFFNIPIVFIGANCVFNSKTIGRKDCQFWDKQVKGRK